MPDPFTRASRKAAPNAAAAPRVSPLIRIASGSFFLANTSPAAVAAARSLPSANRRSSTVPMILLVAASAVCAD